MNIAIWGVGVSGLSTLKYLTTKTDHNVYVINQGNVQDWKDLDTIKEFIEVDRCYSQDEAIKLEGKLDQIILSPGIPHNIPALDTFKEIEKICEIELAYREVSVPIIAVTGTNGKTSTVTMITKALELAGKSVFLGGNIGTPLTELLCSEEKVDYIVLELSSFQLELIDKFHAHISVILNITPSHMERYNSFEDYQNAKINITQHQTNKDLYICERDFGEFKPKSKIKYIEPVQIYNFSKSNLVGEHNKKNLFVVEQVLAFLGIDNYSDKVQELINEFSGVSLRLEFLKEVNNTVIFNDGKSTNTASTISALSAFDDKRVALLLGGKLRDKTQDLSSILNCGNKTVDVFSFGDAADYIANNLPNVLVSKNLEDAVKKIKLEKYDVILFSPAFPSFDQYKNYIDRGNHFTKLIKDLF